MVRVDVGFDISRVARLDEYPQFDANRLESQFLETQLKENIDVEALAQDGGFIFVDDASYFKDGKPSPELQKVVDQLRQRGAEVVILTSNNPEGLKSTVELRDKMTEKQGLGNYTKGTLKPRAIVCIYNTKNQNNKGEVVCVTGKVYESVFSRADMQKGVDFILQGIRVGNGEKGFLDAYTYFIKVFEQREAQATQQALPTYTPRPVEVTAQPERVVVQPQPSFIEQHPYEVGGGVFGAVALISAAALEYFTRPKRKFVAETEKQRRRAMTEYGQLSAAYGQTLAMFQKIEQALSESYPDQVEKIREERTKFEQEVVMLKRNAGQLDKNSVGFFQSSENMRRTRGDASNVLGEAQQLMQVTIEKRRQADDLSAREQAAQTNADSAKTILDSVNDWYESCFQANKSELPSKKTALAGIEALYQQAFQNSYHDLKFALRGSDQALEVVKLLGKFQTAVEAYLKAYQTSKSLLSDSAADLNKWQAQAIEPMRLASTGTKLLNEAKAGISTTDKLVEVVELSNKAEQELRLAKDFANGSATLFELQDENNQRIEQIKAKRFDDRHIASIRKNAQETIAAANQLASQGEWKQAQSKLGQFKSHVDAALAEMQRLDQLKTKTDQDLQNIAARVGETRVQYQKETTPAWNDLQQHFVSGNYDETVAVWSSLRKDERDKAIDLKGYYVQIDKTLTELTDDPSNERDIASQATIKNSLEVQEFDAATVLVRQMEKKLADAQKRMSELLERQQLARKAEVEYKKAIANAQARLIEARESIDTTDEDRLVDKDVDKLIKHCEEMVDIAWKAEDERVYVAALEAATRATDLAIQARISAEEQIAQLKRKYAELAKQKMESVSQAQSIMSEVEEELDAIVAGTTTKAKQALERALAACSTKEKSLGVLEDHALEKGINELLGDFVEIDSSIRGLVASLNKDRDSYERLMDELNDKVREADAAIDSADSRCSHSYAGSAGDRELSSARASMPGRASRGDERSTIEASIRKAQSAISSANTAYAQADTAIRREEERLEAIERERQAEEDRKERERQAEEDRRNQASRESDVGGPNQASGEV